MQALTGTVHFGGAYPANTQASGQVTLEGGASLADDFHVYALEWEPSQVRLELCVCERLRVWRSRPRGGV